MLDSFIYEDHLGRRFVGLDNNVFLNYSELRDYSWSYDTINNRISRFYRKITKRKIPLVVVCNNATEAATVRNRLLELSETDIEARQPGKVWVGDYYTNGYITASKKSDYLVNKRYYGMELTLTSDDPAWYTDKLYHFVADDASASSGLEYPHDYPYEYTIGQAEQNIVCNTISSNAFRLAIFGAASNPAITIGGHLYMASGDVGAGETLVIDSLTKTITLTTATGSKVNWFDHRNRESYIFQPIPSGVNPVSWGGNYGFELTVIEKRSEPKWT